MFQQMKYFIAVVDRHNFTRAAEENNISQPAISQQIKELENMLDVKLLDRKGRSFELTAACLLYTSPSPRDLSTSRMPSSA